MKKFIAIITAALMIFALCGCGAKERSDDAKNGTPQKNSEGNYNIVIKVRNYGKIKLELYPDKAPETVENFINLINDRFYDGLTFHRIMEGFMIQGGDPEGNGTGGSGHNIKGEFSNNGFANDLSHKRGVISMARGNNFNSASSQFFIVQQDSLWLDGQYAAFGTVTEGMEIVDAIAQNTPVTDSNGTVPSGKQPVIQYIKIE